MKFVTQHSVSRAADEAIMLFALASAHYPKNHHMILDTATIRIIESVSAFALNARRAMEALPSKKTYSLAQPRWRWDPKGHGALITDFRDACNRIVHAQELQVGFEDVTEGDVFFADGTVVVPYVRAATDRKELAFIDPFALAYAFLYFVFADLSQAKKESADGLQNDA